MDEPKGPHGGRTDWHQLTLRLTEAEWRKLNVLAQKSGKAATQHAREAVQAMLAKVKP